MGAEVFASRVAQGVALGEHVALLFAGMLVYGQLEGAELFVESIAVGACSQDDCDLVGKPALFGERDVD